MPQIISVGGELVRINAAKNSIERSINSGVSWIPRYTSSSAGIFRDIVLFGREIIACTSKGIFISKNSGSSWIPRYTSTASGAFLTLSVDGTRLLANTSKGLYYSINGGSTWVKRG